MVVKRNRYIHVFNSSTMIVLQLMFLFFHAVAPTGGTGELQNYCYEETFAPSCNENEIIMMNSAKFGMMKVTRCNADHFGSLGCYGDVIGYFDKTCSGKQSCSVKVSKQNINTENSNCPDGLFVYLEASYTCTPVLPIEPQQCTIQIGNKDATPSSTPPINLQATLDPQLVLKRGCGLDFQPLVIDALPGQQFRVTMIDFYYETSRAPQSAQDCDIKYGQVLDFTEEDTEPLCGGRRRLTEVMVSDGHRLQIKFEQFSANKFILKYEVRNCPTTLNMVNGWFQSEGNVGQAGCHYNDKVWHLTCASNVWQGLTGDCLEKQGHFATLAGINITHDFLIMAASGLVLFISIVIVCVGCCFMRSVVCRYCCKKKKPVPPHPHEIYYSRDFQFMRPACENCDTNGRPRDVKPGEQETSFSQPIDNRYKSIHPNGMQGRPLPEIPEYDVPADVHRAMEEQETLLVRGLPNDSGNQPASTSSNMEQMQRIPTDEELRRMQSMIRANPQNMTLFAPHSRMPKNPRLYASTMGRVIREHPGIVQVHHPQYHQMAAQPQPQPQFQQQRPAPPQVAPKPKQVLAKPEMMMQQRNPDIPKQPNQPVASQNVNTTQQPQLAPPPDITSQVPDVQRGTERIHTEDSDSDSQVPEYYQYDSSHRQSNAQKKHADGGDQVVPAMLSSPPPQDITLPQTQIPPQTVLPPPMSVPLEGAQLVVEGQGPQQQKKTIPEGMLRSFAPHVTQREERPMSV